MNPYINAILEKSGSMALQAELDDILGQDVDFFEDVKVEESDGEDQQEGKEQEEEFVDEGEEEEQEEAPKKVVKKVVKKKKKKKKKKRLKRSYTKREVKILRKLRKKISETKKKMKAAKKDYFRNRHRIHIAKLRNRRDNINRRARRRYLKKKGSNNILHTINPFAIKENAVVQGMTAEKKKAYLQQKSISSGLLMGILSTGLYSLYKREESSIHILEDGSQMTKDQYLDYEDSTFSAMSIVETDKMPWKETIMEDPKMSGGVFAGTTLLGSILAYYNLTKKFK